MSAEIATAPVALFSPEQLDIAKNALVEGCKALKTVRRRQNGVIVWEDVPDHPTRITSAKLVVEFGRGKAIATTVIANVGGKPGGGDGADLLKLIASDPDAINALKDTVAKIEIAARSAQKGRPIEIAVTPVHPDAEKRGP